MEKQNIIRFKIPDYRTYDERSYTLMAWSKLRFYGNLVFKRLVTDNKVVYFNPQLQDYPDYNLFPNNNSLWITMVVHDNKMYEEICSADEIQTCFLNTVPIEAAVANDVDDWSGHAKTFKICWDDEVEIVDISTGKEYSTSKTSKSAIRTIDGKHAKVYLKLSLIQSMYDETTLPLSSSNLPCLEEFFQVNQPYEVKLETCLTRECLAKKSMAIKTIDSPQYSEKIVTGILCVKRREYLVKFMCEDSHETIEFWFVYKIKDGNIAKMILHQRCIDGIWDSPNPSLKYIQVLQQIRYAVEDIKADFPNLPGNFKLL